MTSPTPLSTRVRAATASAHRAAETRGFITRLMDGEFDLATYATYLTQYAHVYRAIESRTPQPDDPALINDPRLHRFPSIASDLAGLGIHEWEATEPLKSTLAYARHLDELGDTDAPRYLAHHYTRYLGDLSGGPAIGALMARHYGASPAQLSFYRFEQIDSAPRFKNAYRAALDSLDFTAAQEEDFIAESQFAFVLNGAIFDELGTTVPATC